MSLNIQFPPFSHPDIFLQKYIMLIARGASKRPLASSSSFFSSLAILLVYYLPLGHYTQEFLKDLITHVEF